MTCALDEHTMTHELQTGEPEGQGAVRTTSWLRQCRLLVAEGREHLAGRRGWHLLLVICHVHQGAGPCCYEWAPLRWWSLCIQQCLQAELPDTSAMDQTMALEDRLILSARLVIVFEGQHQYVSLASTPLVMGRATIGHMTNG